MPLKTVTLTGADDRIEVRDLLYLSYRYPFVEWGVLVSLTRAGTPRYPSESWIEELLAVCLKAPKLEHCPRISLHLCGRAAHSSVGFRGLGSIDSSRVRVQINGYQPGASINPWLLPANLRERVILQCRAKQDLEQVAADAKALRASVLYDPSAGRGKETTDWPEAPQGASMGFAGGIHAGSVRKVIGEVSATTRSDLWIDMETSLRTDDYFDLGKVRVVLQQVDDLVG